MNDEALNDLCKRLTRILNTLPDAATEQGRQSLLTGVPYSDRVAFSGPARAALQNIVDTLAVFKSSTLGVAPLAIFVGNVLEAASNSQYAPELHEMLTSLGGDSPNLSVMQPEANLSPSDFHLAELRRRYAAYLRARYEWVDLRGLALPQHPGLLGIPVPLRDIYVPLKAMLMVQHRSSFYYAVLADRLASNQDQSKKSGEFGTEVSAEADRLAEQEQRTPRHTTLDDVAAQQPVVVILGDPGSGKSAFLKHHALTLLAEPDLAGPLPIWLPLGAYAQALEKRVTLQIADYAAQFYAEQGLPGLGPLFAAAHGNGQAVYLLDGLDEVDSAWRNPVADRVVALVRNLGPNRLLTTSRLTGYIPLALDDYSQATLEALEPEQIAAFVNKWYATVFAVLGKVPGQAEQAARHLLDVISQNPGVRKLADNPLTLTLLTLLFFAGNADLPRQRIKLYGLVTKTLIEEWRKHRSQASMPVGQAAISVSIPFFKEEDVVRQVGALAYWMHDYRPEGLARRAEIEKVLVRVEREMHPDNDPVPGVRRFLDTLSEEVGILSPKGADWWGFSHQTFQEYFAARHIVRRRERKIEEEILRRVPDPRWTEVIRLAIAYIGTEEVQDEFATALVEAILARPDPYEPYLHRNLVLAGRILADEPGVQRAVGERVARELFDLMLKEEATILGDKAAAVLLEMMGTAQRPTLGRWIADVITARPPEWQRLSLLASDPLVRDPILSLLSSTDSNISDTAAQMLKPYVAEPMVRGGFLSFLASPDSQRRETAVWTLAPLAAEPKVRNALMSLLADPSRAVRCSVITVLRRAVSYRKVQEAFLALLIDPDPLVREATVQALHFRATKPAVRAALLQLLADPAPSVRGATAWVLGRQATMLTVRAALFTLLNDPEKFVRAAVIGSLKQQASDPFVRAAIFPLQTDSEAPVREAVAQVLGPQAADPNVRAVRIFLLADREKTVREAAVWALSPSVIDPEIQAILLQLLTDPDEGVRRAVAEALRMVAANPVVNVALLRLLMDPQKTVRRSAVWALKARITDPIVSAAVTPLLFDEEEDVRVAVANALGNAQPDPELREQLGSMLKDTPSSADAAFTTLTRWAEIDYEQEKRAWLGHA